MQGRSGVSYRRKVASDPLSDRAKNKGKQFAESVSFRDSFLLAVKASTRRLGARAIETEPPTWGHDSMDRGLSTKVYHGGTQSATVQSPLIVIRVSPPSVTFRLCVFVVAPPSRVYLVRTRWALFLGKRARGLGRPP